MFADEMRAIQAAGFSVSFCTDSVMSAGKPLRNVPKGATVAYRGWMLSASNYRRLNEAIIANAAKPLTSPEQYVAAHHCPNWYPLIADCTPETKVLSLTADLESELRSLGWGAFFIKDYVKSLKTPRGSIIRDPSEISFLLDEMKHYRGEVEGGICVRRVEPFLAASEKRYFVLNGAAFGPDGQGTPELVRYIAGRIPSPFFSVDVVSREDGVLRVVEVGDGQVSDLVGWTVQAFASIWSAMKFKERT